jgi:hypothetical protein
MASQYQGNRWTDEQLEAILFETATWTVKGRNGRVLSTVSNLRQALEKAANLAASGAIVAALCRTPADNIIVFEAQGERLRKRCAGLEVPLLTETITDQRAGHVTTEAWSRSASTRPE